MKSFLLTALLPLLIAAAPAPPPPCDSPPQPPAPSSSAAPAPPAPTTSSSPLADALRKISPDTASCDGAEKPDECRTADQAAPRIEESWATYKIDDKNERAGTVALMIFESASFKYSVSLAHPDEGQGTRNMQGYSFNVEYADFLFNQDGRNQTVEAAKKDSNKNKVLELVNTDETGFATAAWFLNAKCTKEQRDQIRTGTIEGWHVWMADCVGTTNTKAKDDGYLAAQAAMKDLE